MRDESINQPTGRSKIWKSWPAGVPVQGLTQAEPRAVTVETKELFFERRAASGTGGAIRSAVGMAGSCSVRIADDPSEPSTRSVVTLGGCRSRAATDHARDEARARWHRAPVSPNLPERAVEYLNTMVPTSALTGVVSINRNFSLGRGRRTRTIRGWRRLRRVWQCWLR
jgi:hypothetical protein